MATENRRRTLSAEEMRKRIKNAGSTIDLGSGSILGSAPSQFTTDEREESLTRLLANRKDED